MQLLLILSSCILAGLGSVLIASLVVSASGSKRGAPGQTNMLSLAAGALLATAFLHLLPEAFESGERPAALCQTFLFGLLFFFLLDKAEIWHHGHEHASGPRQHGPLSHDDVLARRVASASQDSRSSGPGGARVGVWSVLLGDSLHCFSDGLLIAAAFASDLRLGLIAALAVLAHEVPHHIGDIVAIHRLGDNSSVAVAKVMSAGSVTVVGGVSGWWLIDSLSSWIPYFLMLAGSSFAYVALADLVPRLQKHLTAREVGSQVLWLAVGVFLVTVASTFARPDVSGPQMGSGSSLSLGSTKTAK